MPDIALARCILFVPGDRPERYGKALATGADAVVIDLEDAVAPDAKAAARAAVQNRPAPPEGIALGIRINPVPTPEGIADLAALLEAPPPDFLMIPKVEAAAEVTIVSRAFARRGAAPQLIALIESAEGLANLGAIAGAEGCASLGFGALDLSADLGSDHGWEPMLPHRAAVVAAAARFGRGVLDVPCLALDDEAVLAEETRRAMAVGFTGKLAIHPRQVAPIQRLFTPDEAAVAQARRVLDAFDAARGGVCVLDGKMVDGPVFRAARRVLARAR